MTRQLLPLKSNTHIIPQIHSITKTRKHIFGWAPCKYFSRGFRLNSRQPLCSTNCVLSLRKGYFVSISPSRPQRKNMQMQSDRFDSGSGGWRGLRNGISIRSLHLSRRAARLTTAHSLRLSYRVWIIKQAIYLSRRWFVVITRRDSRFTVLRRPRETLFCFRLWRSEFWMLEGFSICDRISNEVISSPPQRSLGKYLNWTFPAFRFSGGYHDAVVAASASMKKRNI